MGLSQRETLRGFSTKEQFYPADREIGKAVCLVGVDYLTASRNGLRDGRVPFVAHCTGAININV